MSGQGLLLRWSDGTQEWGGIVAILVGLTKVLRLIPVQFSTVQLLSRVRLFETPCPATRQASLSITNSWSLHKLMSIKLVMPSNHHILCHLLLLLLQSFPASGSFPTSQLLASGGKSIGASASASVLPMSI